VQAYLAVALRPGLTMADMTDMVGMSQSSCSWNVGALSKCHRLGKLGMDYVDAIVDPHQQRRKVMYLTPKGKQRLTKALEAPTTLPGGVSRRSPISNITRTIPWRGVKPML